MIMVAISLLTSNPEPSEAEILSSMEPNLCRCGAHVRIVRAIRAAAAAMKKAG